jgi:hypothetical protein
MATTQNANVKKHMMDTPSRQKPRGDQSTRTHKSVECDLEQESAPQYLSCPNRESREDSDFSVHWDNVASRDQTGTGCCNERIDCIAATSLVSIVSVCFCGGIALFLYLVIWLKSTPTVYDL